MEPVRELKKAGDKIASVKDGKEEKGAEDGSTEKDAAVDLGDFFKGVKDASEKQEGGKITVADEKRLSVALPSVSGWNRDKPYYSKSTFGEMTVSEISAKYAKEDKQINLDIKDTGTMAALLAGVKMFLAMNFSQENSDGYERVFEYKGHKGIEKWERENDRAEITFIYSDRYLVEIRGSSGVKMDLLKEFLGNIDYSKL